MPEREVRYCTTEDGLSIAYCVEGDGPTTILALPAFVESFSLDHFMPVYKQFYADLGTGRRVIRFDFRGTGLSSNIPAEARVDVEGALKDLTAVAREAGSPCVVWSPTLSGPLALELTVSEPDLVSHVILCGTFAAVSVFSEDLLNGIDDLVKNNWQTAAQFIADTNGRREFPSEAAQLGEWYFRSMTGEHYLQMYGPDSPRRSADATPLLGSVKVPTLVLHRIADPLIDFSAGQKLAAGIPGARLVPLDGAGHLFCLGDYSEILASVDAFLGDRVAVAGTPRAETFALRTVFFTDLVGHTEMMSRLGDERGRVVLREHERITRGVLEAYGGTEVKTMGDGFLASFGSVTKAVECAIALQKAFAEHEGEPLAVRVGLNAGEPIEEEGDLFGATVILASRIAGKADGGEILVSDNVRSLSSGKGFLFSDRGEFVAKGFDDPVGLHEVRWRDG
jgi:class 3 adenylate cyclase